MDTSVCENKKTNLDELSKEELIKKCKSLLVIAQKAKQTKDALQEENNLLKAQTNKSSASVDDATQELIENLTQQKLNLVTSIEELKTRNSGLESKLQIYEQELRVAQDKLSVLDNENISFKRQTTRLTDENEQLITHLESLEKQIEELNKIGIEQQKQLLELEGNNKILEEYKASADKLSELQHMLGVSLEELQKLKSEKGALLESVENLKVSLANKNEDILIISDDVKAKCILIDELTQKLDKNEHVSENNIENSTTIEKLEQSNEELKKKLKLYHSKIVKFAGIAKSCKEDKNAIIALFKSYTDQVKVWKEQLRVVELQLVKTVENLEAEKSSVEAENALLKTHNEKYLLDFNNVQQEHTRMREEFDVMSKNQKEYLNNIEVVTKEKNEMVSKLQESENELVRKLNEQENDLRQKYEQKIDELGKEKDEVYNKLEKTMENYNNLVKCLKEENNDLKTKTSEFEQALLNHQEQLSQLDDLNNLKKELEHSQATDRQLAEKSGEEILKLVKENKELTSENEILLERLEKYERIGKNNSETQTNDVGAYSMDNNEELVNLKRENTELLAEMNEMNQALKERGETISKLEAHCEEILKKLLIYETQANKNVDNISQKEELIQKLTDEINRLKTCDINLNNSDTSKEEELQHLRNEIESLKEKLNNDSCYAESETMSTSTISRTDEVNRLKELEGSWEERYGKLRNLAVKLKGKIRELTASLTKEQHEKEELQQKLGNAMKTVQTLQAQSDKFEDALEKSQKECQSYLSRLNSIAGDISKDKQQLSSHDETISKLRAEVADLKSDKQATENWKRQISAKVATLRKELETKNLLKKDFETKIANLTADLETKDQLLKSEIESHRQTRTMLEQSNSEIKKNSVLNLEMQDYERSVKDLSQKLDKKQEHIIKLKTQVESQKTTTDALREQIKLLEERVKSEESGLSAASTEITAFKKKINNLEEVIQQKEDKVQAVTQLLETARSEIEELSTELSKVIAEHQKINSSLKSERDLLRSQNLGLQQNLREVQDALKLREDELGVIRSEYDGYKVRAQSVLRQNQSRDVGMEEKLLEESATFKARNVSLISEMSEIKKKCEELELSNKNGNSEREYLVQKCQELESEIEELKNQFTELSKKHQKAVSDHAETVRNLKVHADTLSQCYRQQISDQELRHNREIIELQSKLEKPPSPTDPPVPVLPSMPREEGEGSESIESNNPTNVYPVPLERLLGNDSDQEVNFIKKQLCEQESKVSYLTALLSDTEQDLAKHVQMNKLLKEEIRRQQRSVEREKHAENLEYLKNVVLKFITLSSGDERSRLVPVLNTILKLSPEETQKLTGVAKGDPVLKGWSNYLPAWPSPSKPQ